MCAYPVLGMCQMERQFLCAMLFSLDNESPHFNPSFSGQHQKPAKFAVQLERDGESFLFLLQAIPAQSFTMTRSHAEKLGSLLKKK
jgi:hypothetical protein